MEEGISEEPSSGAQPILSLGQLFDELCSFYMMLGLSFEEFWHGDYTRWKYYVRANELKTERENQKLWLQGLYNFTAFSTALSNMHFDGKRHKQNKYLDKPFLLFPQTSEQKAAEVEKTRKHVVDVLTAFKTRWDAAHKKAVE